MSLEKNKAIFRRWFEYTDREDFQKRYKTSNPLAETERIIREVLTEITTPEFVMHRPEGDMTFVSYIPYAVGIFTAFPDSKIIVEDTIAEGDKVVMNMTLHGTHQGPFRGMPATGKKVQINVIGIARIANGKIVEGWSFTDNLGLMQQLEIIPKQ